MSASSALKMCRPPWQVAAFLVTLLTAGHLLAGGQDGAKRAADNATATAWKQVADQDGVVICSRFRTGSTLEELRAVGEVDARPGSVFAVVNDPEAYPDFMPYTSECRILQRTQNGTVTYQRLDFPLINDRDYTLRSVHSKIARPDGVAYRLRWKQANDLGPAPKPGVQRVKICEGSWVIEPTSVGRSRLTYTVYSGTGGSIPAFLAVAGSRVAIRKIFDAIRKEVREPKYADAKG